MKAARARAWPWWPPQISWRRHAATTTRPVRTISIHARIWKSRQDGDNSARQPAKGTEQEAKVAAAALRRDDRLFAFRGSAAETGGRGEGRARQDRGCRDLDHGVRNHFSARASPRRRAGDRSR